MDAHTAAENGVSQGGARSLPYYPGGQEDLRNILFDQAGQNSARNLSHDRNEQGTTMGREDPRDTNPAQYDASNNIPRSTTPDVDIRSVLETTSQQVQDLASLVLELKSEIRILKSNPIPTATAADNDSPNPPTPDGVGRLPSAVVAVPLPLPPVVPTGEPVHYDSDTRPKCTVKLESYAGQGASLEAFLAKYEEHSRYYRWNADDRVFYLKNCLTGTAATVLWAGGTHATDT